MVPLDTKTQHELRYRPDDRLPFILTLSLGAAGSVADAFVCAFSLPEALTNAQLMKMTEGLARIIRPAFYACSDQARGRMTLQIGEYFRVESYYNPTSAHLRSDQKILLLQQMMVNMVSRACRFRDEAGGWYAPEQPL